jgi:hypothetical protein
MLRFFALILFVFMSAAGYSQVAQVEPTSATDGGVKLHTTKKSRFVRTSKARKTERNGDAVKDSKYKAEARPTERYVKNSKPKVEARPTERYVKNSKSSAEARGTERHGKSVRKSRGSRKPNGESRVFRKHGSSATSSSERRSKVKRSLGRTNQQY